MTAIAGSSNGSSSAITLPARPNTSSISCSGPSAASDPGA